MTTTGIDDQESQDVVASLRSILLSQDLQRLQLLERQMQDLRLQYQTQDQAVATQLEGLVAQLRGFQERLQNQAGKSHDIESDLSLLKLKAQEDAEGIVERLNPVMTNLVRRTIRETPEEMAEAIGPVMGEAIRVQIRDSRKDMVDALYPVIGETVQRAISEFAKEFQRNIDKRLRSTLGPSGFFKRLLARLKGVSDTELALRDALPFELREIFLVQHGSGLLLAHAHPGSEHVQDSALIVAMLTAIRDFVQDAFRKNIGISDGLNEIQYGDLSILIESGKYAYIAVVIKGVEQEGFRATLRDYLSSLHTRHATSLRDYNGNDALLPNLQPGLAELVIRLTGQEPERKMTRGQTWLMWLAGLGAILFVALSCFYLQFTIALYPLAFPSPTPVILNTFTATYTNTPQPTKTYTPAATYTGTPSPTSTFTPTLTHTPTITHTPTATPLPARGLTAGDVWVSDMPGDAERNWIVIKRNTPVTVLAAFGDYAKIAWASEDGTTLTGWTPLRWVNITEPIPEHFVTPSARP